MDKDSRRSDRFQRSKSYLTKHPHKAKKQEYRMEKSKKFLRTEYTQDEWRHYAQETVEYVESLNLDTHKLVKFYREEDELKTKEYPDQNTKFIFAQSDVMRYAAKLKKGCFLIYMSAHKPGGGFLNGRIAQEEMIAYHTDLYKQLTQGEFKESYILNEKNSGAKKYAYRNDVVFIPKLRVVRNYEEDEFLNSDQQYEISAFGSAAVNKTHFMKKGTEDEYIKLMKTRIKKLFTVCLENDQDTIIIGPWGCGVFGGDTKQVINMFLDEPLIYKFKEVHFIDLSGIKNIENVYLEKQK